MKILSSIFFIPLTFILCLSGCQKHVLSLTEFHIKNVIEHHQKGNYTSIKFIPLVSSKNSPTQYADNYIELFAVNYDGKKTLLISCRIFRQDRQYFKGDNTTLFDTTFIHLNENDCQAILDNFTNLSSRIETTKVLKDEILYHDFTVSENLFISFQKDLFSYRPTGIINIWVKGDKFSLWTADFINGLEKFMKY